MKEKPTSRSSRARRAAVLLALALLMGAAALGTKYGRHHWWPKRFVEVVPGKLYRSGQLEADPLREVLDEYQVKTILVLLNDEPQDALQQAEKQIAGERGTRLIRIGMPGDGVADFALLEGAAGVIADASTYPLLVHCAAGVNRTGAAYAVWRMKYCGWDVDRALAEADACGYSSGKNPAMAEHLRAYYRERITSSQPGETASRSGKPKGSVDR